MRFNIATDQGITQVDGEPLILMGHHCFIWSEFSTFFASPTDLIYRVTELKSGMNAGSAFSRDMAVTIARNLFISTSHLEMDKSNRSKLKRSDIFQFPINK